jgi:hypothetical protein
MQVPPPLSSSLLLASPLSSLLLSPLFSSLLLHIKKKLMRRYYGWIFLKLTKIGERTGEGEEIHKLNFFTIILYLSSIYLSFFLTFQLFLLK